MRSTLNKTHTTQRGYTLVEIAMVLAVVGVLIAAFLPVYKLYLQHQIQKTTETNSSLVISAINNFLLREGRYPCPARITAQRDDDDYGMETDCDANLLGIPHTPDNYPAPATAGTFVNGLWFEDSEATIVLNHPDPLVPDPVVTPKVRRGALPFRTLSLPENISFDGFGSRLVYAVTEPQATSAYKKGNGGINITNSDGSGASMFQVASSNNNILLRPLSTLSSSGITPSANPHSRVDEPIPDEPVTPNTNTYLYSSNSSAPNLRFRLSAPPIGAIDTSGTITVKYRIAKVRSSTGELVDTGSSINNFTVSLYANNTLIQTSPAISPVNSGTWAQYQFYVPVSAIPIADWGNLRLRITHSPSSSRGIAISWMEVEVPRLPGSQGTLVDYFLFSPGPDKAGAYSRAGVRIKPCGTQGRDVENCNTAISTGAPDDNRDKAIYNMSERADAPGDDHFDDFAKFYQSSEVPLWRVSGNSGGDISDLLNTDSGNGKIGIAKTPNMSPSAAILQVGGEVRTNDASAMVSEICDTNKANCFIPEALGVADPTDPLDPFQCPAGEQASGFETGTLRCTPIQYTACASGQVMTGLAPDGTLECTNVVGCPVQNIQMCLNSTTSIYDQATLPSGIQGQNYTTTPSGYNYTETWRCGQDADGANVGPVWVRISEDGLCSCTDINNPVTLACNGGDGYWTGEITQQVVQICPETEPTTTEISNTCVCNDEGIEPQQRLNPIGCDPGFTGEIREERTWSCLNDNTGTWSPWTVPPGGDTCTCEPRAPQTRSPSCPTANTGEWEQQRDFQCPAGTWSDWYDTTNTCTCQDGVTDTIPGNCLTGYTGEVTLQRTFNCATNSWGPGVEITNTCGCNPDYEEWNPPCSTGWTGEITHRRDFQCPSATWTSWYEQTNSCACDETASQPRNNPCPAPQSGTYNERRYFNCSTNNWGPWVETENNCYIQSYIWRPKTAAGSNIYDDPLPARAGDLCTTVNASAPCASQAGSGNGWYHYAVCTCE